jgi:hypothetical protein
MQIIVNKCGDERLNASARSCYKDTQHGEDNIEQQYNRLRVVGERLTDTWASVGTNGKTLLSAYSKPN